MKQADIFAAIKNERVAQDSKWGRDFPDRTDEYWLAILTEEVGEAAKDILDRSRMRLPVRRDDRTHLRVELIQCAAVIVSWLEDDVGEPGS